MTEKRHRTTVVESPIIAASLVTALFRSWESEKMLVKLLFNYKTNPLPIFDVWKDRIILPNPPHPC